MGTFHQSDIRFQYADVGSCPNSRADLYPDNPPDELRLAGAFQAVSREEVPVLSSWISPSHLIMRRRNNRCSRKVKGK